MNNKRSSFGVSDWIVIVGVIIIISVLLFIDSRDMGSRQSVVVVISSVASAVVTYLLLRGQKHDLEEMREKDNELVDERREKDREFEEKRLEAEEKRSKGVQIYSSKIAAFSSFNEAVWQNRLDWSEEERNVVINIRQELFSKVILYLSSSEINQITQIIKGQTKDFPYVLSSIVDVLNNNAEQTLIGKNTTGEAQDDNYQKACQSLWNAFNDWIHEYDSDAATEEEADNSNVTVNSNRRIKPNIQPWHFCMYDTTQIDFLNEGGKELSLIEYGENWRTGLVKQIRPGDLIFLFRGNKRYSGAFIAKGWRIFEYDEERNVIEMTSDGIPKEVVKGDKVSINSVEEILSKYDIYESYSDPNSTSCANVVVEPLSYIPEGVPNPNTTYRRTISRYYPDYAISLLDEFVKADPSSKSAINTLFE